MNEHLKYIIYDDYILLLNGYKVNYKLYNSLYLRKLNENIKICYNYSDNELLNTIYSKLLLYKLHLYFKKPKKIKIKIKESKFKYFYYKILAFLFKKYYL